MLLQLFQKFYNGIMVMDLQILRKCSVLIILHYKMWGGESGFQSSQNKLLMNGATEAGPMGFLP